MPHQKHVLKRAGPPAYLSRSELRHQLSLSDRVINRMMDKNLLPKPYDFDGNERWRWVEVELAILASKDNMLEDDEADELMMGIQHVSQKANPRTSHRITQNSV